MDFDIDRIFGAVDRSVSERQHEGHLARVVRLSRIYDTDIDDLWDAVTSIERIQRWFSPVSGDLRLGGTYQIENNASGTITACEPPSHFASTWEFAGGISWIAVHLSAVDDSRAQLVMEHIAYPDDHWKQFGPGAVGVGWDLSLMGLDLYLSGGDVPDPEAFEAWTLSDEGKRFITLCSEDWGRAAIAFGTPAEEATAAAASTTAFYTGEMTMEEPGS